MNVFVIDPSDKYERLIDSNKGFEAEQSIAMPSRFRVEKDYDINYFNFRKEKKQGKFTLGLWSDVS